MIAETDLRRTPLHDLHEAHGGRMVAFAGWRLPIQYTGVIDEHQRVRTRAGLFDVSHMGEAEVRGPQAAELLDRFTPNAVARLERGRAHYNALTTAEGTFVDDILIYRRDDSSFLLVLNAANTDKDLRWLEQHAAGFDVEIEDTSADWAQLALQGPLAPSILSPLAAAPVAELRYYGFVETEVAGVPALVSRTGYTGEDGFELYVPANAGPQLWRALIEAGEPAGLAPAGLGARDTLRLEAKMALYGHDIDETTTVIEADLSWIVKLDKGDFLGREVLAEQKAHGAPRKLVGFEMLSRAVARAGYPARYEGREVGAVRSGSHAPTLHKNIGLIYMPPEAWTPGTRFEIDVRGRAEPAMVVATPFYKRPTRAS